MMNQQESHFPNNISFYTEHGGNEYGVEGEPVPYTVRGDDLLTSLLLICFIVLVVFVSRSRFFIKEQIKDILYVSNNDDGFHETTMEQQSLVLLCVTTCLVFAICSYYYTVYYLSGSFAVNSDFSIIAIFFLSFLIFMPFKILLYTLVNSLFFEKLQNRRWLKTVLFLYITEGTFVFPVTMLLVYFDLSPRIALYYIIFVLFVIKTVTIYKCWHIFFSQNGGFLQTILYFCTLEIVPILNLVSGMLILIDNLTLNF